MENGGSTGSEARRTVRSGRRECRVDGLGGPSYSEERPSRMADRLGGGDDGAGGPGPHECGHYKRFVNNPGEEAPAGRKKNCRKRGKTALDAIRQIPYSRRLVSHA